MLTKDKMLQILSKYGMDLNGCAPYFYEENGKLGLVYEFSHAYYGILNRVFIPKTEEELDTFAYQYWWYQNYAKIHEVEMELDEYDTLVATPHFVRMKKNLSKEDMKKLLTNPDYFLEEIKKNKTFRQLLRTVNLLMEIISLKHKTIQDTKLNVLELEQEVKKQENEFLRLYNLYRKTKKELNEIPEISFTYEERDFHEFLETLEGIKKTEDIADLKHLIDRLWVTLKEMETEEEYLKNKHSLMRIPLELEDIRMKKSYMEALFNKKKGLFAKKENPDLELERIDRESETKKLISKQDYILDEVEKIHEKYSIISEMDYTTLGDYLNDFDNMGITISLNTNGTDNVSHDVFLKRMEEISAKLSHQEQECLAIYHSFLEPICDNILRYLMDGEENKSIIKKMLKDYEEDIDESLHHLGDAENVFIRMQKMRLLDLTNEETFLNSLIFVCKEIMSMKKFYVLGPITVFGKSLKEQTNLPFYHANFKTSGAPVQQKGYYDVHDVIEIKERVPFLYFSKFYSFRDPFFHDYSLQEEAREDVFLLLKDYQVNFEKSVIIKVSRYKIEQRSGKDILNISLEKMDEYRYLTVSF